MSIRKRVAAAIVGMMASTAGAAEYVWWEGEKPAATNFPARTHFMASNYGEKRELLSGGDWLSSSGKRGAEEAFARWTVEVPESAEYHFWTRKFYTHGPFRWRFDQAEWQNVGRDVALADSTPLAKFIVANWVSLGKVNLTKGKHTFEIQLDLKPGEEATAAFDCFVLTRQPFSPRGKLKPGEKSGKADEGFFAWEPALDPFKADALLDLRHLNERVAGQSGFLKGEGFDLKLGNGQPVRFWAVNIGPNNLEQEPAAIDFLAKRLAKLGVNMVRIHGTPFRLGEKGVANEKFLAALQYAVAAFKREGIYSSISFYFPLWFEVRPEHGIAGYETIQNKKPFALLYFDPQMRETYRGWAKALLTAKNPHGPVLAREPAVGIVELVNEDSFFFWSFNTRNIPAAQWAKLEAQYGQWLVKRYGSIDKAIAAWGGGRHKNDDAGRNRAGLYEAWDMTSAGAKAGGPAKAKRVGDQVRFLTELQRAFYASTTKYLKEDVGFGGLVSASNWTTADPAMTDALERYTYAATDVIDRHGYFGGKHEGDGASYSVRAGHAFEDAAAVLNPEKLPIQAMQVDGHPQIISEIGWTNPNRYRADFPFIAAAYGALQGVDGVFFFAVGSNYLNDGTINKFPVSTPIVAGGFPAAALVYRRGDVKEAATVVQQVVNLEDLFAMKGSGASTAEALDELRKQDVPAGGNVSGAVSNFDPLSFYVGRVVRGYGDPGTSYQKDVSKFIDRRAKVVKSAGGELTWDYGKGLIRLDSPKTQGACGFLGKAGKVELSGVTIECGNEFASILVTSLDDLPIETSRKVLIQATTEERPYGFKAGGGKVEDLGGPPMGVRRIDAKVAFKTGGTLTVLDENGYARGGAVPTRGEIKLAEDSLYQVLTR